MLFFVMEAVLIYFYLILKQCENYFFTNLVKIHYVVIDVLSVSCFVLFLSNSKWWPSWSVQLQKIEMASCNNYMFRNKVGSISMKGFEILSFSCLRYF